MKRSTAGELGRDTVRILEAGRYRTASGQVIETADAVARSVAGTCSYPPDVALPGVPLGNRATRVEVANESTLAAALRLVARGQRPAALNFASAKHPGGGFLGGARAQEESLARSSGLYACINGNPMYAYHQASSDALYSDYAIYSPDVPVFRDDDGQLLSEPYLCAFITSPAPNAKVVLERDRRRRADIRSALERRIRKVLAIAAHHGHEALVLGAWGCGVFGNDGEEVAELFRRALAYEFQGVFAEVIFAVLDWSEERRFIGPFEAAFGA
ncbi:MAG: TIGR02452 family protein [Planctomycetia bacterium]|nr:TIGR02452 family protein [Planctomycetia bacterium]